MMVFHYLHTNLMLKFEYKKSPKSKEKEIDHSIECLS